MCGGVWAVSVSIKDRQSLCAASRQRKCKHTTARSRLGVLGGWVHATVCALLVNSVQQQEISSLVCYESTTAWRGCCRPQIASPYPFIKSFEHSMSHFATSPSILPVFTVKSLHRSLSLHKSLYPLSPFIPHPAFPRGKGLPVGSLFVGLTGCISEPLVWATVVSLMSPAEVFTPVC